MIVHARPRRPGSGARKGRTAAAVPYRKGASASARVPESTAANHGAQAALTASQRRYLRGLCHDIRPLIQIGNKGVTDAVNGELAATLDHHELVKIRLSGGDRAARQQQLHSLLEASGAELVQQIGHVVSVFRRNPQQPRLALPA